MAVTHRGIVEIGIFEYELSDLQILEYKTRQFGSSEVEVIDGEAKLHEYLKCQST